MRFLLAVHQPLHGLSTYTWDEIGAVGGLIVIIAAAVTWLIRLAIMKPMQNSNSLLKISIDELRDKIGSINGTVEKIHDDHGQQLHDHEVQLAKHEIDIENLKEERLNQHAH